MHGAFEIVRLQPFFLRSEPPINNKHKRKSEPHDMEGCVGLPPSATAAVSSAT
jgi:hypothetical protein